MLGPGLMSMRAPSWRVLCQSGTANTEAEDVTTPPSSRAEAGAEALLGGVAAVEAAVDSGAATSRAVNEVTRMIFSMASAIGGMSAYLCMCM